MKRIKYILLASLFCIYIGHICPVVCAETVSEKNTYIVTVMCCPDFETDSYDNIVFDIKSSENNTVKSLTLTKANNYVEQIDLPNGEYYITVPFVDGDGYNAYSADKHNFTVSGTSDFIFTLSRIDYEKDVEIQGSHNNDASENVKITTDNSKEKDSKSFSVLKIISMIGFVFVFGFIGYIVYLFYKRNK